MSRYRPRKTPRQERLEREERAREERERREEERRIEYAKLCFSQEEVAQIPDYLTKYNLTKYMSFEPLFSFSRAKLDDVKLDGYLASFTIHPLDHKERYPILLDIEEFPFEYRDRARQDLDFASPFDAFERIKDTSRIYKIQDVDNLVSKLQDLKKEYISTSIEIQYDIISDWLESQLGLGRRAQTIVDSFIQRIKSTSCAGACYSVQCQRYQAHRGTYSKQDFLYNLPTIYEFYALIACQTKFEMVPFYSTWGN